jgi:hypothetical protein
MAASTAARTDDVAIRSSVKTIQVASDRKAKTKNESRSRSATSSEQGSLEKVVKAKS